MMPYVRPGRRAYPVGWLSLLFLVVALVGCAPAGNPPTNRTAASSPGESQSPRTRKVLVAAIGAPLPPFGPLGRTGTYAGAIQYIEAHSHGLVTSDDQGRPVPQLARELPSLDRGTARLLDDGRMVTTWNLREDVRWHDGTPFTAQDIVFGLRVYSDQQLPAMDRSAALQMESGEAIDTFTAQITWKAPHYLAGSLGLKLLWPLPSHLLAESYEAGDKERFLNLSYWTKDYVHTGPFRLAQLDPGAEAVFEAYDGYFRGRPKVDAIVIRPILDSNALFASVLSGDVDLTIGPIEGDQALALKDQWELSRAGSVVTTIGNSTVLSFQLAPELTNPRDVLDPRVRQALHYAIDRAGITELSTGGRPAPELEARSILPPTDPLFAYVKDIYADRASDPGRALQRFGEAGWSRGADGMLISADGRRITLEVRASRENLATAIASGWRQVGVDATVNVPSPAQSLDLEWAQAFPGVQGTAQTAGDSILNMLYGPTMATARNNYGGNNRGHYNNPRMNDLIDRFRSSLRETDRGPLMREIGDLVGEDQPIIQPNFNPIFGSVRKGVRALGDLSGGYISGGQFGAYSRTAYLWEKE
jgi:peptide/nickel transport system substrate-binding protein